MHPRLLPSLVVTSLGVAAANLMKDARVREIFSGKGYYECDDVDSMPSDRLSSDLDDTWHHGLAHKPAWAGGLELDPDHSANTEEDVCEDWSYEELGRGVEGAARDYISEVRESSSWAPLCDCLTPADVLVPRLVQSGMMPNCTDNLQSYSSS